MKGGGYRKPGLGWKYRNKGRNKNKIDKTLCSLTDGSGLAEIWLTQRMILIFPLPMFLFCITILLTS